MAENNMTVELEQTIQEPVSASEMQIDFRAAEKQAIVPMEEYFRSIARGESSPFIPGLTSVEPNLHEQNEETLREQRKRQEEMPNTVLKIAGKFKKALISTGTMIEDANIAFNRVVDEGFQAIKDRNPKYASRVLTEPIHVIVEAEGNKR